MSGELSLPEVVSEQQWRAAREPLLAREKELMRELDALAAERRRQPMVEVATDYRFHGPEGELGLLDLFAGRRQLIVYHFMLGPDDAEGCPGCSMFVDNLGDLGGLAHLHARDTSFALISRAPLARLEQYRRRMGWELPWYSSCESRFNDDFGTTTDQGEIFAFSVFIRDAEGRVFRTYMTDARGVEAISSTWDLLDRTPLGRQEEWEQSPEGRPQGALYSWWRRNDSYGDADDPPSA